MKCIDPTDADSHVLTEILGRKFITFEDDIRYHEDRHLTDDSGTYFFTKMLE